MRENFKFDVFLSYSSTDKRVVRELANLLKSEELRVWFDEWEIKPGDLIPERIEQGLKESRTLVLAMSKDTFSAEWTKVESATFRFRDPTNIERRFIPLRLDDAEIEDSIKPFHYVDYRSDPESAIRQLKEACLPPSHSASGAQIPRHLESRLAFSHKCVRPLHETEDRFLQVLLPQFTVVRLSDSGQNGFELQGSFDDSTPAIWDQEGKRHLLEILPEEKRKKYQEELDTYLRPSEDPNLAKPYEFDDDSFVFRYASGGTLPIITFSGPVLSGEYYCFFYRDVYPIGWNIANGGTDTRAELLNPQETIDRELREELIIADFGRDERYVFPGDEGKSIVDHPAHAVARRLWTVMFPNKKLTNLKETSVLVDWVKGPDSLRIQNGDEEPVRRDGFFLNINGEDFGIEFDRVAMIRLPGNVILFDGEIDGAQLVNAPIGLFEVSSFNSRVDEPDAEFRPDHFFFGAALHNGGEIDNVLENRFLPHLEEFRTVDEIKYLRHCIGIGEQYRLCAVTKRIAKRFLQAGALSRT